jgi:SAM-dependent methyltransferase
MTDAPPQPETITRLFDAVHPAFALLAGMELELFTPLEGGPLSAEQIADAIGVQAIKLRPLLYALVVAGLLTVEDELFSNTPEANHYLVRGKPDYQGGKSELTASNWARMLEMAATIRAGGPPAEYDYHATQEELIPIFRGLYPGAVIDAHQLMDRHDFSATSTLLDVGGGSGGLAIAIAQANPHLKATVMDLPSVTPITQQFVEEANAGDQVEIVAANAVRDTLSGSFDVVVARHVIQVLSEEDSRALLNNLASVVRPGGVLQIVGWILDNSRLAPEETVGYNLVLLSGYSDGQAYTEQEYYDWLEEAGFVDFRRTALPKGASLLTARKPAE